MAERSFGPTVLGGLAAGALAAVAGNRAWIGLATGDEAGASAAASAGVFAGVGQMPLSGALALVLLACWGVVLVSRGRWRRWVLWLALVVAVGLCATWVTGLVTLEEQVTDTLADRGADPGLQQGWTTWFWLAGVAAAASVAATAVAVARVGHWPTMASRYDAPTDPASRRAGPASGDDEQDSTDLWKAIDEGRDPTAEQSP